MSILALVTTTAEAEAVVRWGTLFARARETSLVVLAWTYSPIVKFPLLEEDDLDPVTRRLADEVNRVVDLVSQETSGTCEPLPREAITVRMAPHPDPVQATLGRVRLDDVELIVAAGGENGNVQSASGKITQLLRQSPCHTVILYGATERSKQVEKVWGIATDGPFDRASVALAARLGNNCGIKTTVATIEEDTGDEAFEVGRRELRRIMRDAHVKPTKNVRPHVVISSDLVQAVAAEATECDLVLLGADQRAAIPQLLEVAARPTIALVKRAPPLRPWRRGVARAWVPRLHPEDYADLIQNLRRGSRWGIDFMMMLGTAAGIATLGLLQSSTAVVIGSMLLAPLMTPMVGSGLALAQANTRLVKICYKSIFSGFLLTLAISFCLATITPGEELTPEVVARGTPNLLDLLIALCSGVAASYALARPNLAGSIAGVAIAVALVPPLCSVGICLAYANYDFAAGAAVLFTTNLVAIILAAAGTFRAMGVTSTRAAPRQRRWVYRIVGVLATVAVILVVPLDDALVRQVEMGKPQPLGYPLPRSVAKALLEHVDQDPGVQIMLMARPSVVGADYGAVVYVCSEEPLPKSYADDLIRIVRDKMQDQSLKVLILCVQQGWQTPDETPGQLSTPTDDDPPADAP